MRPDRDCAVRRAGRAGLVDEGDGLNSRSDAELVESVLDVLVDGVGADADRGRDALCRKPFSYELEHLRLSLC